MEGLYELRAAAVATAFRMEAEQAGLPETDIRDAVDALASSPALVAHLETLYRRISLFQQDLDHMEAYAAELLDGRDASEQS